MSDFRINHWAVDEEDVEVRDYGGDNYLIRFGDAANNVDHFIKDLDTAIAIAEQIKDQALEIQRKAEEV